MTYLLSDHMELFAAPPVLPSLLDYYGDVYIVSDSTLKTKTKPTKVGKVGVENDFLEHFQSAILWEGRRKSEEQVVIDIMGGATLKTINAALRQRIAKEDRRGRYIDVAGLGASSDAGGRCRK